MANFKIPRSIGEISVVHTRDAVVTITLNPDGKTYEILIDGALYRASASMHFMISFVEGLLQNDLEMESDDSIAESQDSSFEP
jgi:hypothetical protein